METLEEKSNDFEGLIKLEERDNTIISIINRISPKLQKKIYDAIKVKINYAEITWETQKRWTEVHEYLLGIDLARQNQDSSHLAIKKEETKEIIEGRGQNIRFRLYYAATYRHGIETPYAPVVEAFFQRVDRILGSN